jgi:radical SAM protein with 4Fe4S-binding SPASM domain
VRTSDDHASQEQRFALGLGLTNACNLSCSFCYRDPTREDRLGLEQVQAVLCALPLRSVNLGTGENGMHPEFARLLAWLARQPVKLTITSNGHTIAGLADEQVRCFHDVELSLDHPTEREQDAQRGPGNWRLLHEQAERCVGLGVPVTFITVVMRSNFRRLAEVADVARRFGAPLRVNVYQAVRSDAFALRYHEYWEAFERLLAACDAISIGEPLVRAMAGLPPRTGGCGQLTVRVTPRATVQPCVYWPAPGAPLATLLERGPAIVDTEPFREARSIPTACARCAFREICRGGCAGRRQLRGEPGEPDPYCPVVRGEARRLHVNMASGRDMPKGESACTTIVMAR